MRFAELSDGQWEFIKSHLSSQSIVRRKEVFGVSPCRTPEGYASGKFSMETIAVDSNLIDSKKMASRKLQWPQETQGNNGSCGC